MYESLNTTRLFDQVIERIETLIFNGQLKPGDRLPAERELGEQFGVSRTVIREAVKSLQEKGLVDIRPGVGTFIHDGSSEIMRKSLGRLVMIDRGRGLDNLTQVREIFEPEIAAIAAEKATPADLEAMELAVATMDDSLNDVDRYISADHDFHLALAAATQNKLIVDLLASIVDLLSEQRRRIFHASTGGAARGQQHHKLIMMAVRKKDSAAARKQMTQHMKQVRTDIAPVLAAIDDNEKRGTDD
jgi:GntR family transcriptional repressor for pyruvate dehydrogenase complex